MHCHQKGPLLKLERDISDKEKEKQDENFKLCCFHLMKTQDRPQSLYYSFFREI